MRFEVLSGKHVDLKTERIYRKGEVIESERDLALLFPDKYRALDAGGTDRVPKAPPVDVPCDGNMQRKHRKSGR